MGPTSDAAVFQQCRAEIDAMITDRESLPAIEAAIDRRELSADQKAALWLLAWSSQDPTSLRDNLEATLRLMAGSSKADREVPA
jgi:hypothetical protein